MFSTPPEEYLNGCCILCNSNLAKTGQGHLGHPFDTQCERCGRYRWFTCIADPLRSEIGEEEKVRLAGYVQDQNRSGVTPLMENPELRLAISRRRPGFQERALRLLRQLGKDLDYNTGLVSSPFSPAAFGTSYSKDKREVATLLDILAEQGFVNNKGAIWLKPSGLLELDVENAKRAGSARGFIAMSFDPSMEASWTGGFEPAITSAGYLSVRIDRTEHNRSISDEIMANIRRSSFVVADYTLSNNGVYFEAGFALGYGVQVIATCREDHMSSLHFDIRHINTLQWNTPEELKEKLIRRITGVVGEGPSKR